MSNRLLDRQVRLLDYLTSGAVIFDDMREVSPDDALAGIDCGLLRLEARFSYQKRMQKIAAVFPRTFDVLNGHADAMIRDFVNSYPPRDIGRLENARQFHDFLCASRERFAHLPPFLCDVAACELAYAQVRAGDGTRSAGKDAPPNAIRRDPRVVLLRCSHDVRPIFETALTRGDPVARETLVGVAVPAGADQPRIFELLPPVFDLLSAMDGWIDPTSILATPKLNALVRDLSTAGLIEVRT